MTAQLTNLQDDDPDRELAQVLDQLSRRFPRLPAQRLHELARTVHERFRDAPVRTLVPLLVEHQVVEAVRRTSATLSAAEGSLSPPTPSARTAPEAGHGRDEIAPEASPEPRGLQSRARQQAQRRGIIA